MNSKLSYKVNPKEYLYYYTRLIISLVFYLLLIALVVDSITAFDPQKVTIYVFFLYGGFIAMFLFFRFGILIGFLKGNGVKLSQAQFPDIHQVVVSQAKQLGLRKVPSVYILQSGGMMNAFAARFLGHNYIILFSEIVESALEQDRTILEFVIGHELGHIKRNHMRKKLFLWPSYLIPFLGAAYSRACEYTCDSIGHALSPYGVKSGLLLLASGKTIYRKVNVKAFIHQDTSEDGFWKWFAEKVSSHPNLTKRLVPYVDLKEPQQKPETLPQQEKKEEDHSRYMPQF